MGLDSVESSVLDHSGVYTCPTYMEVFFFQIPGSMKSLLACGDTLLPSDGAGGASYSGAWIWGMRVRIQLTALFVFAYLVEWSTHRNATAAFSDAFTYIAILL